MKFYCGSILQLKEKPFPKAYQEELDFIQFWPTHDLERNPTLKQTWEEKGINHRQVKIDGKSFSSRVMKITGWFIDFNTLDELLAFCNGRPHKKIVIEQSNNLSGGYAIYQTKD